MEEEKGTHRKRRREKRKVNQQGNGGEQRKDRVEIEIKKEEIKEMGEEKGTQDKTE